MNSTTAPAITSSRSSFSRAATSARSSAAASASCAAAADVVSRATGRHLPLNRKLARQLLAPAWTCTAEKAERVLGFRHERSIRESIERSADWYLAQGWL